MHYRVFDQANQAHEANTPYNDPASQMEISNNIPRALREKESSQAKVTSFPSVS
jgi:hypothetical protein